MTALTADEFCLFLPVTPLNPGGELIVCDVSVHLAVTIATPHEAGRETVVTDSATGTGSGPAPEAWQLATLVPAEGVSKIDLKSKEHMFM